jgi:rRNA maturation endonuclease Nob1
MGETTFQRRKIMDFEGYCVKCKQKRPIKNAKVETTANGRRMAKGACPVCGTTVTRFLSSKEAG